MRWRRCGSPFQRNAVFNRRTWPLVHHRSVPSESDGPSELHLASRKQFTPMFGAPHQKHLDSISYGSGMRGRCRDRRLEFRFGRRATRGCRLWIDQGSSCNRQLDRCNRLRNRCRQGRLAILDHRSGGKVIRRQAGVGSARGLQQGIQTKSQTCPNGTIDNKMDAEGCGHAIRAMCRVGGDHDRSPPAELRPPVYTIPRPFWRYPEAESNSSSQTSLRPAPDILQEEAAAELAWCCRRCSPAPTR